MTEPYNSASVCSMVCEQFDDPKTEKIVKLVDEYARGEGYSLIRRMGTQIDYENVSLMDSVGWLMMDKAEFKKNASRYVRNNYGFPPIAGWLAWLLLKPLIMQIIEAFLNQVIVGDME